MQTLRDWYRYLERQMQVSLTEEQSVSPEEAGVSAESRADALSLPSGTTRHPQADSSPSDAPGSDRAERAVGPPGDDAAGAAALQPISQGVGKSTLGMDLGSPVRRRVGRRPMTETREEIIRRLLDPELTLHEAAAVLRLSKATVRRYTDHGKLACLRTEGGQRRFRFSVLLAFLDRQGAARDEG